MLQTEQSTEQIFGDGPTGGFLQRHHQTNVERLVGPLAHQGEINTGLTAGLDSVEERVVNALGTTGKKKNAKARYFYDAVHGILRRNDDFAFVGPPVTLPDVSWNKLGGLIIDRGKLHGVLLGAIGWARETVEDAASTFEQRMVDAGKVIRRGKPIELVAKVRGLLVDVAAVKAELLPWLVVWGIKGDPIRQAREEQAKMRQEILGNNEVEEVGLLVEDAMRYVVHGAHKPRSLATEFIAEQVSRRVPFIDRTLDVLGTVKNLTPERVRNIEPILAGDLIPDMNVANLEQPLQDHNIAEDTLRINDMYVAMVSPQDDEAARVARINYLQVLEHVLRDESGYNSHGPHLVRAHNLYDELRQRVTELENMKPEQLAKVNNGAHRLLMGRQILESFKVARILVHRPEEAPQQ